MTLAIVAAIAENRVIGREGRLPWHLPEDLAIFQRLTTGRTLLMGRRTFDTICADLNGPLPGRRNVVLSSEPIAGVETFSSLDQALASLNTESLVFIIGGQRLYEETLHKADLLYLSHVHLSPAGDTFFPEFRHLVGSVFLEVSREKHAGFDFVAYRRNPGYRHAEDEEPR